jgi:DNA-binding MarR family transcriptional regulator
MSDHGPGTSPGFWLHHAYLAWRAACEARLGETTYPQFNILSAISLLTGRGDGPPTQQQAAGAARMDRKMASKLIATLEDRALVARVPDPADARARRLRLTEAGREVLRSCVAAARQADAEVFGTHPDSDRLLGHLRAIAERRAPPS